MISDFGAALAGRSRIELVQQSEATECGLACIAMVLGSHGMRVDLASLRRRYPPSSRGMTLQTMIGMADQLGLSSRAVRLELDELQLLSCPAILHWDLNHFVVLERTTAKGAVIHDPRGRSATLRNDEISRHFTGVAVELTPAATFETGTVVNRLRLSQLWTRIHGFKRTIAQTIALSLLIQLFALATPFYLQIAIDSALPNSDGELMTAVALAFALLTLLNGLALALRSGLILNAGAAFGFGLSSNLARKLFSLPIDWFSRRGTGDILNRFQSTAPIRKLLSEDAPATIVDGLLAVVTLSVMFFYSSLLASIALGSLALCAIVRMSLMRPQQAAQEHMLKAMGQEQSTLIESIRSVRSMRISGRTASRHALWASRMVEAVNGSVRTQRLANWQNVLQVSLISLENIVSVWMSFHIMMRGDMTIGMLFAFFAYKTQFLLAGASLLTKAADFRLLNGHLDRIADIALAEDDFTRSEVGGSSQSLRGRLELRDISFRYNVEDQFILTDINLTVEPGECLAITGPSGGGKTTILHILLGLSPASSGEVLVDGVPMRAFGYANYHRQIAAVLQDDVLLAGSIADNIAMFDELPDVAQMENAAKAASIYDEIRSFPMGFETLVGDMGLTLSGGQRQRILLARALYSRPKVLFLDEATSHLDESHEQLVNDAVSKLGITRVVVAHRKETIARADRVVRLEGGSLRTDLALPVPKSRHGRKDVGAT